MRTNIIIVDDFYNDPMDVRNFALSQEFKVRGNYPGARTGPMVNDSIQATIQNVVKNVGGNITEFPTDGYNGSFQVTYAWEKSWIHSDHWNNWAGVCYLTPDAPLSGGTGIFMHKETKRIVRPSDDADLARRIEEDGSDITKWELVDSVGNRFNRLVLFRSDAYHMSLDYFGRTLETCRLFQVFFFNTEY